MNNLLKSMMVALIVLSVTLCSAQIKNNKTETIKINGNCGMCKSTIEKSGNKKKEAVMVWNKDSKIATIYYDSLKTSKYDILKRVALAGYDNELFASPIQAYENSPSCCQYKRADRKLVSTEKPIVEMGGDHSEHLDSEVLIIPYIPTNTVKTNYLKSVFDNYFEVKNSLVQSDEELTSTKATLLLISLEKVKMDELEMDVHLVWMKVMKDLKKDAWIMRENEDIDLQRISFISLSSNMYSLLKVAKYDVPVYYQHCPMANDGKGANWLSTENIIRNPYYGSAMLSCGKTVETTK